MLGDMMGKLQDMKQKMDEIKARLDTINVEGSAAGGAVKVVCTGNRKIKSIDMNEAVRSAEKEEQEDLLVIALNDALEQAEDVYETEMKGAASGMLPGLGGLGGLFGK